MEENSSASPAASFVTLVLCLLVLAAGAFDR
jgi:hypothetical protein